MNSRTYYDILGVSREATQVQKMRLLKYITRMPI